MKLFSFGHHKLGCIITSVNWHGRHLTPVVRMLAGRHYIILRHRNVTSRFWFTPAQEEALQAFKDAGIAKRLFVEGIE